MKKIILTLEQKIKVCFLIFVAILEIVLMFFNSDGAILGSIGMFCLYAPDTILSFLRKKEDKWMDLCFMLLYLILTIVFITFSAICSK